MKCIALYAPLLLLSTGPVAANAKTDETVIVTTDDSHDYVSAARQTLVFPDKMMVLKIDYKNPPTRELSKISVTCMKQHRSMSFDHTYFGDHVLPLIDTGHDADGHLQWASFSMEMRTDRRLKAPDRVFGILCTKEKIEFSILGEEIVP
jgi:hypothetical protein